jgi:hypothetical protein
MQMRARHVGLGTLITLTACLFGQTLGQVELHETGGAFGEVFVTRTLPVACDGGEGHEQCTVGCAGASDDGEYLCGFAYEPGAVVVFSASAYPASTFAGWTITMSGTTSSQASPVWSVTPQSATSIVATARFDNADAGGD